MTNMFNGAVRDAELHRLIRDVHEGAALVPLTEFRGWALAQLRQTLEFERASWGTGSKQTGRVHSLKSIGEPAPPAGRESGRTAPAATHLLQDWLCSDAGERPGITVAQPLSGVSASSGDGACLETVLPDAQSGLLSFVSLERRGPESRFSEHERAATEIVVPHLLVAWRVCQMLNLYARAARAQGRVGAIVDRQGYVQVADSRFHVLLRAYWRDWSGARLPAPLRALAERNGTDTLGAVRWTAEAVGDTVYLCGESMGALARLTAREQTIAAAILDGHSYGAAAERLGISVNTLRNTLVRVYRKLAVKNKLELAQCLQATAMAGAMP